MTIATFEIGKINLYPGKWCIEKKVVACINQMESKHQSIVISMMHSQVMHRTMGSQK